MIAKRAKGLGTIELTRRMLLRAGEMSFDLDQARDLLERTPRVLDARLRGIEVEQP